MQPPRKIYLIHLFLYIYILYLYIYYIYILYFIFIYLIVSQKKQQERRHFGWVPMRIFHLLYMFGNI